jgi:hypothetical protein
MDRAKIFVANFSYFIGYSWVLQACCAGWCGRKVARGWCRVWAANSVLHAPTALGLNPMAQAACNDFNKKLIDTTRVYQPSFAVYISLGGNPTIKDLQQNERRAFNHSKHIP